MRQWSAKPACPAAAASATIAYVQSWLATSAPATSRRSALGSPLASRKIRNLSSARPARESVTSASSCSGTRERAAAAKSHAALPGPARSKSISATARPSLNTRLAGYTSLWLTSPVRNLAGTGRGQE